MQKQKQRYVSNKIGDCFGACVASLLELPLAVVPNDHSEQWWFIWRLFLKQFGLEMHWHPRNGPIWQSEYWIASVKSKNFEDSTHAIIMNGSKVEFDPSPSKNR